MVGIAMSFAQIAHIYDQVNNLAAYQEWIDFTKQQVPTPPKRALDLACGTGYFSFLWAKSCQALIGIDLDPAMVKMAEKKLGQGESPLEFKVEDMTDLTFADQTFDCITCYLDSLCFLPNLDQVQACFAEVYRVLEPGGTFLFDVWTQDFLLDFFDDFINVESFDEGHLIWQSQVDFDQVQVTHDLTVYEGQGNSYQRSQTSLQERTYPLDDYLAALLAVGFNIDKISVWPDFQDSQPQSDTSRWVFVVHK